MKSLLFLSSISATVADDEILSLLQHRANEIRLAAGPKRDEVDGIFVGAPGKDCNQVCEENGRECSEDGLEALAQKIVSKESMQAAAEKEGLTCEEFLPTTEGPTPYIDPAESLCYYTPGDKDKDQLSCTNPPPITTTTPPPPPNCNSGKPTGPYVSCNCRQDPLCDSWFGGGKAFWFHGFGVFHAASTKSGLTVQVFQCPWLDGRTDVAIINGVAVGFANSVITYTRASKTGAGAPQFRVNGKVVNSAQMYKMTFPGGWVIPGGDAFPHNKMRSRPLGGDWCIGDHENTIQVAVNTESKGLGWGAGRWGVPSAARLYETNWRLYMSDSEVERNTSKTGGLMGICVHGPGSMDDNAQHPYEPARVPWNDILFSVTEMDFMCKWCYQYIHNHRCYRHGDCKYQNKKRDKMGCQYKGAIEAAFPPDNTPAICESNGMSYDDAKAQCGEFSEQFVEACVIEVCQNVGRGDAVAAARKDVADIVKNRREVNNQHNVVFLQENVTEVEATAGDFDRRFCQCETTSTTTTTTTKCEDNFEDLALTQPTNNNLGNMGGPSGACKFGDKGSVGGAGQDAGCEGAVGPQEIRYPNVKEGIDFVITTRSENYDGWDERKNGVRGVFGNINVNKELKVDFTGCFYKHDTYEPVTMPLVPMTFYDLDEERDRASKEAITVCSGGEAFFPGHTELMMTKEGDCTTVRSCCYGKGKDNPKTYEKLQSRHTARTATFTFKDATCVDFGIETGETENDAGRNFLFDFNPTNICKDYDKPMIVPPPCCQYERCKQWPKDVKEDGYVPPKQEVCDKEPEEKPRPVIGTTTTTTIDWKKTTTTTTFTGEDPREGKQPQCDGCGPRANECWKTCNKKAGKCNKCNAADGTLGACCIEGASYPKECRGGNFIGGGNYFECVLINPAATYTTTIDPVAAAAAIKAARDKTATTTKGDYREGAVAGCSGCGPRRDECWRSCGSKAGFCSTCNSQDGYQGACCMRGRSSDPPECKNAVFTERRYHECVLVNPLVAATTTTTTAPDKTKPYVCAEKDGDSCECTGKVYYGKKFINGRPGGGALTTWQQMLFFGHKVKDVQGRVTCSGRYMGGDPVWGYYKYCYCVTPLFSTTTTTTPSGMESCPVNIGNSRSNTRCRNHHRPVICSGNSGNKGIRAGGGNANDYFQVTVTGGTQVCARRLDSRGGWGLRLQLNCVCPPTTTTTTTTTTFNDVPTPAGLESCPVDIGRSNGNTRCVNYHKEVFCSRLAGNKGLRAGGGNWNDAFDVQVSNGNQVCVTRTDSGGGWTIRLKLGCGCKGTTTTSTPSGLESCPVNIDRSGSGKKCVQFSREVYCAVNSGDRGVRAGGGNWNDKFAVSVNGREVCAQRIDQDAAWGMRLKLACGCPTTTTTTTTDYRQGQRAGCSGCGWRRDECWSTCRSRAGFCHKCNNAQGSAGACCMRGREGRDPPECSGAKFTQSGYHECVLVNPLQVAPITTLPPPPPPQRRRRRAGWR